MELRNTVVLVTGGGTGIGRATSLALAAQGAAVAVNYSRSAAEAAETVAAIRSAGGRALAVQADVRDDEAVRAMVAHVTGELGPIDLLVNNAGITRAFPLSDLESATDEVWDDLYAVNVKGMFHCARAVAPSMKARGAGVIVNVGSIAGITGEGSSLPYAVSKAAVHGLTKSLARALAPEIRVCCVVPGMVQTRWWQGKEDVLERLSTRTLLGRTTLPEDIASTILWMAGLEALTGQIVTVDSGQTL